jgi:hypothetical protein
MRDKRYEPGNNPRRDIEVCLAGAGHLYDAKTAQPEIAERFIGTVLPKLVKTLTGALAGQVGMAKTLELGVPKQGPVSKIKELRAKSDNESSSCDNSWRRIWRTRRSKEIKVLSGRRAAHRSLQSARLPAPSISGGNFSLGAGQIASPIGSLLAKQANTSVMLSNVTGSMQRQSRSSWMPRIR